MAINERMIDCICENLISELYWLMKEDKRTVAQIAAISGLKATHVSRVYASINIPRLSTVVKMADALGYDLTFKKRFPMK